MRKWGEDRQHEERETLTQGDEKACAKALRYKRAYGAHGTGRSLISL
jgi:hypothetical protein